MVILTLPPLGCDMPWRESQNGDIRKAHMNYFS